MRITSALRLRGIKQYSHTASPSYLHSRVNTHKKPGKHTKRNRADPRIPVLSPDSSQSSNPPKYGFKAVQTKYFDEVKDDDHVDRGGGDFFAVSILVLHWFNACMLSANARIRCEVSEIIPTLSWPVQMQCLSFADIRKATFNNWVDSKLSEVWFTRHFFFR